MRSPRAVRRIDDATLRERNVGSINAPRHVIRRQRKPHVVLSRIMGLGAHTGASGIEHPPAMRAVTPVPRWLAPVMRRVREDRDGVGREIVEQPPPRSRKRAAIE